MDKQIPRILFHGTCRFYAMQQIKKHGVYRNDTEDKLYLGRGLAESAPISLQRADFYGDFPLLMVVDTQKIDFPIEFIYGQWRVDSLNLGSFDTCSLGFAYKLSEYNRADVEGLAKWTIEAILGRSKTKMEEYNLRNFA